LTVLLIGLYLREKEERQRERETISNHTMDTTITVTRKRTGTAAGKNPPPIVDIPLDTNTPSPAGFSASPLRASGAPLLLGQSSNSPNSGDEESKEFHLLPTAVDTSNLPSIGAAKIVFQRDNLALDSSSPEPMMVRARRSTSSGPSTTRSEDSIPRRRKNTAGPEPATTTAAKSTTKVAFASAEVLHADFYGSIPFTKSRVGNTPRSHTATRSKKSRVKIAPESRQMVSSNSTSNLLTVNGRTSHGVEITDKEHVDRLSQTLRLVVSSPKKEPISEGEYILDDSPEGAGGNSLLSQEDVEYLEKNDAVSPSVFFTRDKMLWEMKGRTTPNINHGKLDTAEQELVGEWIGEAMDLLEGFVGILEKENLNFFETHAGSAHKFKRITHLLGKARNALVIRLPQLERNLTTTILNKKQEEQKQDKQAADISDWISKEYAKKLSSGSPTPSVYQTMRKRSSNLPIGHSRSSSIDEMDSIVTSNKTVRSKTLSTEMSQVTTRRLERKLMEVVKSEEKGEPRLQTERRSKFRSRSQSAGSALASEYCKLYCIFFL
jgi:hypothetical protein